MNPGTRKRQNINFLLHSEGVERLDHLAERNNLNRSEVLRACLIAAFNSPEQLNAAIKKMQGDF